MRLVQGMYSDARSHVCVGDGYSEEFEVKVGVHQDQYSACCSSSLCLKPYQESSALGSPGRTSMRHHLTNPSFSHLPDIPQHLKNGSELQYSLYILYIFLGKRNKKLLAQPKFGLVPGNWAMDLSGPADDLVIIAESLEECVRKLLTWKEAMERKGLRQSHDLGYGTGPPAEFRRVSMRCLLHWSGQQQHLLQWLQALGAQEMQWAQALEKGP